MYQAPSPSCYCSSSEILRYPISAAIFLPWPRATCSYVALFLQFQVQYNNSVDWVSLRACTLVVALFIHGISCYSVDEPIEHAEYTRMRFFSVQGRMPRSSAQTCTAGDGIWSTRYTCHLSRLLVEVRGFEPL